MWGHCAHRETAEADKGNLAMSGLEDLVYMRCRMAVESVAVVGVPHSVVSMNEIYVIESRAVGLPLLPVDTEYTLVVGELEDDGQNDAFLAPDDPDTELWARPAENQWTGTLETRESYVRYLAIPAGIAWERWERVTISSPRA